MRMDKRAVLSYNGAQNYLDAWTRGRMSAYFANSLINTLVSLVTALSMLACADQDGMALWQARDRYFAFGIMVPVATTRIPLFLIFSTLDLHNNRWSRLIVYAASALSFSINLISGFWV
jgi:raffinose/stachyose/melibiose transport system permease protein